MYKVETILKKNAIIFLAVIILTKLCISYTAPTAQRIVLSCLRKHYVLIVLFEKLIVFLPLIILTKFCTNSKVHSPYLFEVEM